jgi:HEAT repeat protein
MRASRLILTAALLALPRLAAAQPAQPAPTAQAAQILVTETSFDVDGDGAADRIRIEQPGVVHIALARGRALRERIDAPPGTLRHATVSADAGPAYGGRRVVVVTATFATGPAVPEAAGPEPELPGSGAGSGADMGPAADAPLPVPGARRGERSVALVLAWQQRALTRLWQGPVGWRGDGEHSVHVATTPLGLLRYQARPEVARCDGQPVYLYPEAWDFRSGSFRPVYNAPRLPANAPVLTAASESPPGAGDAAASSFRTRAASAQAGAASAGDLVPPRELDDRDPGTVWRETLGGNGRGEIITLGTTLPQAAVAAVRIVPGDAGSAERFRRGNRLHRVGLLVGKERAFWVDFPTDPARTQKPIDTAWWVILPAPVPAQCVTLVLDSVYPGAAASSPRTGDTVIAELAVLTTLDLAPEGAEAALIDRVRAGGAAGRSAARLLAQRGPAAVAAVRRALEAGTLEDAERLRLRQVLAEIGDPATAPELAEGLADERASAAERRDFLRALVRLGSDAVPALAAVLVDEKAALPGRTSAARALGEIAVPAARDALIAAAGQGPRPLRRTVTLALGHRDPAELDALLAALAEAERAPERPERAREADLWRAAGLLVRRAAAADRARAMAAMIARLASASGYELVGRLLGAAGPLGDPALLDAVASALARLPAAEPESKALHRIAAVALADSPLPAARGLLVDLLGAADPGVRRAAADALGRRSDADAASDQALITRLREDTWPRIRHLAAAALATRCGAAEAPAQALAAVITTDASDDVRRGALTALVTCRAPGIGALLLQTADSAEQPTPVRQRAITLVAVLGDRGLTPALVKLFGSLRGRAWSDAQALRLAAAAAVTLGRLGDPAAVPPLLAAARDPAFPELQAAAITGLAEMCPRQALSVFERARDSVQRSVSIAARSASRRCARKSR